MKNILLILAIAFSSASFAQGNLQYDSTITLGESITDTYSSNTITTGVIYTVPDGKTLKIESMIFSGFDSNNGFVVYINSMPFVPRHNSSSYFHLWNFPLWLKSGDTIQFGYNHSAGSGIPTGTGYYLMSALQFNIVP